MWVISIKMHPKCGIWGQISKLLYHYLFYVILTTHPGSGSDWTIASEQQNTALVTLYIGGSVTCSQRKHRVHKYVNTATICVSVMNSFILT